MWCGGRLVGWYLCECVVFYPQMSAHFSFSDDGVPVSLSLFLFLSFVCLCLCGERGVDGDGVGCDRRCENMKMGTVFGMLGWL